MPLTGTTNTSAQTALRYLAQNQAMASSSLAKLSSGSRIVKASDDAASLAVGTKLKADVTALKQAAVNAGQASSLLQVADGGMAKVADILQRMKALAVQAQSGSVTDNERAFLDREYQQLIDQVDAIAEQTKFNGRGLINGAAGKTLTQTFSTSAVGISALLSGNAAAANYELSYAYTAASSLGQFTLTDTSSTVAHTVQFTHAAGAVVYEGRIRFDTAGLQINLSNFDFTATFAGTDAALTVANASTNGSDALVFQVGVDAGDTIVANLGDVRASALGFAGTDITTAGNAITAGNALDAAISAINDSRATLGALMSRFEFASANLATSIENLDAARSTLLDVDMAAEMTRFTSAQVLTQAGVAMLAQANQMPQNLLRLLQ
jgi:flagellin